MTEYHHQTQYTVSDIHCDTHLHNHDRQRATVTDVGERHTATTLVGEASQVSKYQANANYWISTVVLLIKHHQTLLGYDSINSTSTSTSTTTITTDDMKIMNPCAAHLHWLWLLDGFTRIAFPTRRRVILFGTEHNGTHTSKYKIELIHRCRSEHFRAKVSTNLANSKHRINIATGITNIMIIITHNDTATSNAGKWNYNRTKQFSPACTCGRGIGCLMFNHTNDGSPKGLWGTWMSRQKYIIKPHTHIGVKLRAARWRKGDSMTTSTNHRRIRRKVKQ